MRGWCGVAYSEYEGEWWPHCPQCKAQAEQMFRDYQPPIPHGGFSHTTVRGGLWRAVFICWGIGGYRFDRNCPACVKAAEEYTAYLTLVGWSPVDRHSDQSFDLKRPSPEATKAYHEGYKAGKRCGRIEVMNEVQALVDKVSRDTN